MPKKKKPVFIQVLEFLRKYWILIVVVSGAITTMATLPARLTAMEQTAEEKHKQYDGWIEAYEGTQEMIKKAPIGFRWDETVEEFILWKDDPRRKKR